MCSLNTSYQVLLQHKDYDGSESFYVKAGRLRALCASYQAAGQTLTCTATSMLVSKTGVEFHPQWPPVLSVLLLLL